MVSERRVQRLCSEIKQRVAAVLQHELNDPRLGFVTVTGVTLDREMTKCTVYWSVIGDDTVRRHNARALDHAAKFVQHEVAEILSTRTAPQLDFAFDESIAGSIRVQQIIDELNEDKDDTEGAPVDEAEPPGE